MTEIPPIISVDDHIVEPPDLWQRWLPEKHRAAGPRVVQGAYEMVPDSLNPRAFRSGWTAFRVGFDGPRTDWWVYEDFRTGVLIGNAAVGRTADEIVPGPIRYAEMRPGCYDREARIADMTLNHVERSLCFPTFPRFCGQTFLEGHDRDLGLACVRAYNDFMVEEWAGESGGRLIPLCLIPLWDADLAAAEVHRNAARGVRAVAFSELPAALGLPSIHDRNRYWDPFFRACDETGTVINMHIGSSSQVPITSNDAPAHVQISLTAINSQLSMSDWLLSGVLARFPDLKLAFSEGQIGWMPFLLERLDTLWRKRNYRDEWDPGITDYPSTYVPGRIWGCFFEDDFGISVRDAIGVDQITFETDYPHQDSTWPDSRAYAKRIFRGVPAEDVEKIVRGNAIRLFQLPEQLPGTATAPRPAA
ncbi:amidohydrolase family protein [Blastococcus sp. URHD0036]|uniref:amidohydrolase family protein n=1 Tax=Blastococcus sp. URHD0036 TaxID=1380356 RepID=UPI00068921CD|nr:amidohydrolase family protein [Blastococcus sp. URHD0036]